MPAAKVRDKYISAAMQHILACKQMRKVNTLKNYCDAVFVIWFVKAVHLSMTHLRDIATYTERFAYRIGKLRTEQRLDLQELIDMISPTPSSTSVPQEEPFAGQWVYIYILYCIILYYISCICIYIYIHITYT